MGYTHYWRKKEALNEDDFKSYSKDVEKVVSALRGTVKLVGGHGVEDTKPEFTKDLVCFNGVGDDAHETFYFNRSQEHFSFTKTAYKPYDVAVTACLIIAKYYFPKIEVSSDGEIDDWKEGFAVVKSLFDYDITLEKVLEYEGEE